MEAGEEDVARNELGALAEAWPAYPLDPRYEAWLPGPAVGGPSR
jgi:hypothetical protein